MFWEIMMFKKIGLFFVGVIFLLSACSENEQVVEVVSESERLNQFFDEVFDREVAESPESQTWLGIKTDYDKWDDYSPEAAAENLAQAKNDLNRLQTEFAFDQLDENTQLSYRLFERLLKEDIEGYRWRYHTYPVNQMFGWQSGLPSFLVNFHQITNLSDAEAYVSRLEKVKPLVDQRLINLEVAKDRGISAPKFVFDHVIRDAKNVISGAPFDEGEDSTLLADFKAKVGQLDIAEDQKADLINRASAALLNSVKPAFEALISLSEQHQAATTTDDGVWKLPDGDEYYAYKLKTITTTDMTADEIHQLGLSEVARIQAEMRAIQEKVGFEGTLQDFFKFVREDDQFYYPDTPEGKAAYLEKATAIIDNMRTRLDEVFITKPKAEMIVKAVEPFREKSAGIAFYSQPAIDGSRPGIYYANLYNMRDMSITEMEALAYHEGLPGHHMQIAIAQELQGIPKFRRFGGNTAYIEGWGLYAEFFPKEMGLYEDPYSDFGRLSMELWRACRLVVDTGLHDLKWTREQAIKYLDDNTPASHNTNVKAIERYIVMPGQATAYTIGMLKIIELRERARAAFGDQFDIREYHERVLEDGALPLLELERKIDLWIAAHKKG